jgi:acyl-CoA thioester hydrolase
VSGQDHPSPREEGPSAARGWGGSADLPQAGANHPTRPRSAGPPSPLGEGLAPTAGSFANGVHRLPVRVYYEDTDFSGVVYHASYLRFLERGRTDSLRLAGVDRSLLHAGGEGLIFAVRRMTIDYLKAARMDDVLVVETRTAEVRGASLAIAQRILRDDEVIVTADVRVAAVAGGRPARIPDELRAVLTRQR